MIKDSNNKPVVERRSNKERRVFDSRREEIRWEPQAEQRRKIPDRRKSNILWSDKII